MNVIASCWCEGDFHDIGCPCTIYDEQSGGNSRFLYIAKPSRKEKEWGLEELAWGELRRVNHGGLENEPRFAPIKAKNTHPTVKPVSLLRYLSRLVTPPGGVIADPFMGSGTHGVAALLEGYRFYGWEDVPEYFQIADARIQAAWRLAYAATGAH